MSSPFEGARVADLNLVRLQQHDAIIREYDGKAHFLAMLGRYPKPSNVYAEWDVASPQVIVKGTLTDEASDKTEGFGSFQPCKLRNHSEQKRSAGWHVSRRAEAVEQADTADEVAKQRVQDTENHVLDWESSLLADLDASDTPGSETSRMSLNWLKPVAGASAYGTGTFSQRSVDPIPAAVAVLPAQYYDGSVGTLSGATGEATFKAMLTACAKQVRGRLDLTQICGLGLKGIMSGWATNPVVAANAIATRINTIAADEKKLLGLVDFFQYDTGIVRSMLTFYANLSLADNVFQPGQFSDYSGIGINPKLWKIAWLRPIRHYDLDDKDVKGGGRRGYHESDGMLMPMTVQGQYAIVPTSL